MISKKNIFRRWNNLNKNNLEKRNPLLSHLNSTLIRSVARKPPAIKQQISQNEIFVLAADFVLLRSEFRDQRCVHKKRWVWKNYRIFQMWILETTDEGKEGKGSCKISLGDRQSNKKNYFLLPGTQGGCRLQNIWEATWRTNSRNRPHHWWKQSRSWGVSTFCCHCHDWKLSS